MSFVETVQQDMQQALKAKDTVAVSALRSLKAALQKAEIEAKGSLDEQRAFAIVKKEIKQREDSIAEYTRAGRADLTEVEQAELEVLLKYQPEQLSEEAIVAIIEEIVSASGTKDFGPLMGQVMGRTNGLADGKVVQDLLKKHLA